MNTRLVQKDPSPVQKQKEKQTKEKEKHKDPKEGRKLLKRKFWLNQMVSLMTLH